MHHSLVRPAFAPFKRSGTKLTLCLWLVFTKYRRFQRASAVNGCMDTAVGSIIAIPYYGIMWYDRKRLKSYIYMC